MIAIWIKNETMKITYFVIGGQSEIENFLLLGYKMDKIKVVKILIRLKVVNKWMFYYKTDKVMTTEIFVIHSNWCFSHFQIHISEPILFQLICLVKFYLHSYLI